MVEQTAVAVTFLITEVAEIVDLTLNSALIFSVMVFFAQSSAITAVNMYFHHL